MNWKLNYWTVLFALAVAALGYSYLTEDKEADQGISATSPPEIVCGSTAVSCRDTVGLDTIPGAIADWRISHFAYEMIEIKERLDSINYDPRVSNFLWTYAKLPRCEMYEMLCKIDEEDVYVFPTIERDPEDRNKRVFSIVMGDKPYIPSFDSLRNEIVPGDFRGIKFFDFAKPCPNACPN